MLTSHPWLVLLVPAAFAAAGFATNWLMVRALFYPVQFVGIPPWLGWQGIIARNADTIARQLVRVLLERVGSVRDVYLAMDPERIAEHLLLSLRPRVSELVEDAMLDADPRLWDALSAPVKARIAAEIEQRLPELVNDLVRDIGVQLEELVDVDYLTTVRLVDDKRLLNHLIGAVGKRELFFIGNVGIIVGFLAGVCTVLALAIAPVWWVPPLLAMVIFAAGDVLARAVVFSWPVPRRIGRWRLQGLIYRNQDRGARVGTRIVTRDVLSVEHFVRDTLDGPNGPRARALIGGRIAPVIDHAIATALPTLDETRSEEEIARVRSVLIDSAIVLALEPLANPAFNRERHVVLEDVFLNRMLDLTPSEYGRLVEPAVPVSGLLLGVAGGVGGLLCGLSTSLVLHLVAW